MARTRARQSRDDPSVQEHQRLLRQARNRRYYAKKQRAKQDRDMQKTLALSPVQPQTEDQSAAGGIVAVTSTGIRVPFLRCNGPFSLPAGPAVDPQFVAQLQDFNCALEEWGFGPLAEFKQRVVEQFTELRRAPRDAQADFIDRQELWIVQGDEMLDSFDRLVAGDLFERLPLNLVAQFWKEMTAISFQILYAMAAVEARLDALILPAP